MKGTLSDPDAAKMQSYLKTLQHMGAGLDGIDESLPA